MIDKRQTTELIDVEAVAVEPGGHVILLRAADGMLQSYRAWWRIKRRMTADEKERYLRLMEHERELTAFERSLTYGSSPTSHRGFVLREQVRQALTEQDHEVAVRRARREERRRERRSMAPRAIRVRENE